MDCVVIGGRRYYSDLPQGGLEILCKLTLNGKRDDIKKPKHLLAHKAQHSVVNSLYKITFGYCYAVNTTYNKGIYTFSISTSFNIQNRNHN